MKEVVKTYAAIVSLSWLNIKSLNGTGIKELLTKFFNSGFLEEIFIVMMTSLLVIITQLIMKKIRLKLNKSKLEKEVIQGVIDEIDRMESMVIEKLKDRGDRK